MLTDVDISSIILVESLGILSFLLALVFFRQYRKISNKQESLKKAATNEVQKGPCYSYKWVMSHSMKHKKLLTATPALAVFIGLLWAVWYYYVGYLVFVTLVGFGYVWLIALTGVVILLLLFEETNVFEAYSYGNAIQKVTLDHLNKEDQSYMEHAKEALEKAIVLFPIMGIVFSLVGPLIPRIVGGLIYALLTYTGILFHSIEMSKGISSGLAVVIAFAITTILIYLPQLLSRIIYRRVKLLARRIWERWRKR